MLNTENLVTNFLMENPDLADSLEAYNSLPENETVINKKLNRDMEIISERLKIEIVHGVMMDATSKELKSIHFFINPSEKDDLLKRMFTFQSTAKIFQHRANLALTGINTKVC